VIGTTDDPATPYESAQALSRDLESARLLTYVGEATPRTAAATVHRREGRRLSDLAPASARGNALQLA
jgi:hypothetical protein